MCLLGDCDQGVLPGVSLCGFLSKESCNTVVWNQAHARQEVALGVCSLHTRIPARSLLTPSSLSHLRKEGLGGRKVLGATEETSRFPSPLKCLLSNFYDGLCKVQRLPLQLVFCTRRKISSHRYNSPCREGRKALLSPVCLLPHCELPENQL